MNIMESASNDRNPNLHHNFPKLCFRGVDSSAGSLWSAADSGARDPRATNGRKWANVNIDLAQHRRHTNRKLHTICMLAGFRILALLSSRNSGSSLMWLWDTLSVRRCFKRPSDSGRSLSPLRSISSSSRLGCGNKARASSVHKLCVKCVCYPAFNNNTFTRKLL